MGGQEEGARNAQSNLGYLASSTVRLYNVTDISSDPIIDIEHSEPPVLAERKWRTHALDLIHKLSQDVLDAKLISPILKDIASVITSSFPISFSAIETYEGDNIVFSTISMNSKIQVQPGVSAVAPLVNTLAGEVLKQNSTLILSDAYKNDYLVCPSLPQPLGVYHYIGIPLMVDAKPSGVLSIATTHNIVVDKETVTWAETIGHHISALLTREAVYSRLKSQENIAINMLNALSSPTMMCSKDGSIEHYNSAFESMIEEFHGRSFNAKFTNIFRLFDNPQKSNSYVKELRSNIADLFETPTNSIRLDLLLSRPGYHRWYLATMSLMPDTHTAIVMFVDISDRKRAEEKLEHEMLHDQSTGLANRFLFHDRLSTSLMRNVIKKTSTCVMAMDVGRYGFIVESLGYATADKVIALVAKRIEDILHPQDLIARIGSSEFALLIGHISDPDKARNFALNLIELFRTPFEIEGQELFLTPSVGITLTENDSKLDADIVLHDAHAAMTQARDNTSIQYAYASVSTSSEAYKKLTKEKELNNAIEQGHLDVYYQPEYDLNKGEIIGAEALVRWIHPEHGILTPEHFIELAEESGLIDDLFEYVFKRVSQDAKRLYSAGYETTLWVNLSAKQLAIESTVNTIAKFIEISSLPSYMYGIELTETAAMENAPDAISTLVQLKNLGLSLALDDFGTGYSSLAYLQRFPVDLIKIDRTFIAELAQSIAAYEIVSAVVGLAHGLNLEVLAEGVETQNHVALLREIGCDRAQGYFFAHPRVFKSFLEILNTDSF